MALLPFSKHLVGQQIRLLYKEYFKTPVVLWLATVATI